MKKSGISKTIGISEKVLNTDQLEKKKQRVKVYVSLCAHGVPSYGSLR